MMVNAEAVSQEMQRKLRKEFDVMDVDGDGKVSSDEMLRYVGANLPRGMMVNAEAVSQEMQRQLRSSDLNGDGFVTFDEMVQELGNKDDEIKVAAFQAQPVAFGIVSPRAGAWRDAAAAFDDKPEQQEFSSTATSNLMKAALWHKISSSLDKISMLHIGG